MNAALAGIFMEHKPKYLALINGCNQIVCSCGWESPKLDEQKYRSLGMSKQIRSCESFFEEHKALVLHAEVKSVVAETTMQDPASERAVTPAQKPQHKKPRR